MTVVSSITHVVPALARGGMEQFVMSLCSNTAPRLRSSIVCTAEKGALWDIARERGLTVDLVPSALIANWIPRTLAAHFRCDPPSIVHSHSGAWLKAARAARRAGVPKVLHTMHGFHEGRSWLHDPLERTAVSLTDFVVAVSDELRDYAVERLGASRDRVVVIKNGIDASPHQSAEVVRHRRHERFPNEIAIGFVGRLAAVKAPGLLLEAFERVLARVHSERPELRVSLEYFGDGPLANELAERVAAAGINANVTLRGAVDDIPARLAGIDVFCLPSTSEGTSIALLEAMASGCAVVATAVGGTTAVLSDRKTGILVESGSAAALSEALWRLVSDRAERLEYGRHARDLAIKRYSIAATAAAYDDLYAQLR